MKNIVLAVSLVAVVALGALGAYQHSQITRLRAELTSAQSGLEKAQAQLQEHIAAAQKAEAAQSRAQLLQQTLNEAAAAATAQSQQVTQLEQSLAAAKTNGPANLLGGMFKDPAMRKMIKEQQKMVIGTLIDQQYSALFKQLNLTPDQAATLKSLIEKKTLAAADSGMSLLGADPSQRKELAKQMKDEMQGYDDQIKQLLGADDYQAYEGYQKTLPDRMTLNQFDQQMADASTPLNADQQQRLLQAMSDERASFKWTTDLGKPNPDNLNNMDLGQMFTPDRVQQFGQDLERFNQQVLARAQQILTADQLAAFEKFQNAQRQTQVMSMKLAGQMFGPQSK